jgi:hypothetical protein
MPIKPRAKRLSDAYRFPGFRPFEKVRGVFGDPKARVIKLIRRSKKLAVAPVGSNSRDATIVEHAGLGIFPVVIHGSIWSWRFAG